MLLLLLSDAPLVLVRGLQALLQLDQGAVFALIAAVVNGLVCGEARVGSCGRAGEGEGGLAIAALDGGAEGVGGVLEGGVGDGVHRCSFKMGFGS